MLDINRTPHETTRPGLAYSGGPFEALLSFLQFYRIRCCSNWNFRTSRSTRFLDGHLIDVSRASCGAKVAAGISTSRLNFDQFTGARMTKCPQNIRIAIPAE